MKRYDNINQKFREEVSFKQYKLSKWHQFFCKNFFILQPILTFNVTFFFFCSSKNIDYFIFFKSPFWEKLQQFVYNCYFVKGTFLFFFFTVIIVNKVVVIFHITVFWKKFKTVNFFKIVKEIKWDINSRNPLKNWRHFLIVI